jgi:hypothetical protein
MQQWGRLSYYQQPPQGGARASFNPVSLPPSSPPTVDGGVAGLATGVPPPPPDPFAAILERLQRQRERTTMPFPSPEEASVAGLSPALPAVPPSAEVVSQAPLPRFPYFSAEPARQPQQQLLSFLAASPQQQQPQQRAPSMDSGLSASAGGRNWSACLALRNDHKVVPGRTWGSMTKEQQVRKLPAGRVYVCILIMRVLLFISSIHESI